jgi:hypothetical protein
MPMQTHARQAKDVQMIEWTTYIRLRAERRAGQLLSEMRPNGEHARGGGDLRKELPPATLSDFAVTAVAEARPARRAGL